MCLGCSDGVGAGFEVPTLWNGWDSLIKLPPEQYISFNSLNTKVDLKVFPCALPLTFPFQGPVPCLYSFCLCCCWLWKTFLLTNIKFPKHTLKRHFNWYFRLKFPFSCSISNAGCRTSAKAGQSSGGRTANCVLESGKLI